MINLQKVMYFDYKVSLSPHSTPINRKNGVADANILDEYKSLQSLHLWRPTFMSSTSFVLTYDAEISLHLNCVDSLPDIAAAKVERLSLNSGEKVGRAVGGVWKGEGDSPSVGLFKVFEGAVKELAKTHTGKHISLVSLPSTFSISACPYLSNMVRTIS